MICKTLQRVGVFGRGIPAETIWPGREYDVNRHPLTSPVPVGEIIF